MSSLLSLAKSLLFLFSFTILISLIVEAIVPTNETFTYVNQGEFGIYIVEYGADYRPLPIATSPFQVCFYNTTPNSYTLALRMATSRSESLRRWVWEANRGNPVGGNATFSLKKDGNLVLADADGRIAWQTNTGNKDVVAFRLLPNGNMVLVDSKGKYIWQSFDSATDTLLVGQSFRPGLISKLVSRKSETNNSNGPYSFVMEQTRFAMYYKSPNPYLYFTTSHMFNEEGGKFKSVVFNAESESGGSAFQVYFAYDTTKPSGSFILTRPKYNASLSFLRLEIDGNLKVYTYDDDVDWGAWEVTFTLFDRESIWEDECQLPERCGNFGLCESNQCVACPQPSGLYGWSQKCKPVSLPPCGSKAFGYYRLEGVDHFMSKYTSGLGPMKLDLCGKKCSSDCKCLGYFYNTETSRCWIAYELKTLKVAENSTHLGFIKAPKT